MAMKRRELSERTADISSQLAGIHVVAEQESVTGLLSAQAAPRL